MRLFVAIPVDDQIKRRMLRVCDDIDVRDARVRWCSPEQLHLTLKFIGAVEESLVKPICDA
ncbi:MAG: RNA 2',3'-cyclic phosphodiesterase, partial [Planctomycetes bacterium]|nr:RNA 2',3'-cyclic phosphodiesterase [Planctomycetota bacterium]